MRSGERWRGPLFSPAERLVLACVVSITVVMHLWGWWQSQRVSAPPEEQTAPFSWVGESPQLAAVTEVETPAGGSATGEQGLALIENDEGRPASLATVPTGEVQRAGAEVGSSGHASRQLPPSPTSSPSQRQPVTDTGDKFSPSPGQALAPEPKGTNTAGPAANTLPTRVSLNRAEAAELEALPGIGPTLARRIIEYREQHGPFRSVEELREVPGIGEARLRELRSWVTVP